jgi:molecular chaperone GrpE
MPESDDTKAKPAAEERATPEAEAAETTPEAEAAEATPEAEAAEATPEAEAAEAPAGDVIEGVAFIDPDPALAEAYAHAREVEARLRAVSAAYKQLQEEMENARERTKRQAALQREIQRGELVAGLFEPLENLRRSIQAISDDETISAEAKEGLGHVGKQFMAAFSALGLVETGEVGSRFDPNLHEAIGVIPVADAAQDEAIMEVFSKGYRIGSRLLQPAKVLIGRHEESTGEA